MSIVLARLFKSKNCQKQDFNYKENRKESQIVQNAR